MNSTTLIILLVVGVLAYVLLSRGGDVAATNPREQNPAGGDQHEGPPNVFQDVLKTLDSLFGAVKSVAQTSSKNT